MENRPRAPKAKRGNRVTLENLGLLPVYEVSDKNPKHIGYLTGISVEVFEVSSMKHLYENGSFGIGSKNKAVPYSIRKNKSIHRVTQQQYNQLIKWQEKFGCDQEVRSKVYLIPKQELLEIDKLDIPSISSKIGNVAKSGTENVSIDTSAGPSTSSHAGFKCKDMDEMQQQRLSDEDSNDANMDCDHPVEEQLSLIDNPFEIEESLVLTLEEAFFLHYNLKCLKILDIFTDEELSTETILMKFNQVKPNFIIYFVAYLYLRTKTWVVKSGIKFGGDFLLYENGPNDYHATFVAIVLESWYSREYFEMNELNLQTLYRVCETAKKELLIVEVFYPENLSSNSDIMECLDNLNKFAVSEFMPIRFDFLKERGK